MGCSRLVVGVCWWCAASACDPTLHPVVAQPGRDPVDGAQRGSPSALRDGAVVPTRPASPAAQPPRGLEPGACLGEAGEGDCDAGVTSSGGALVSFPFSEGALESLDGGAVLRPGPPGPVVASDRYGTPRAAYAFSACQYLWGEEPSALSRSWAELSVAVWIRADDPAANQKIVGRAHKSSPDGAFRGWAVAIAGARLNPEIWDVDGRRYAFNAGQISAGAWTHLAVTWRSGGALRGYIDGALVWNGDASAAPIGDHAEAQLRVGVRPWSRGIDWCFSGSIDDIRIYDRELTAAQVASLADAR